MKVLRENVGLRLLGPSGHPRNAVLQGNFERFAIGV